MRNGKKEEIIGGTKVLSALIKSHEAYLSGYIPSTLKSVFTLERLQKIVVAAARKNPDLLHCTPESVIYCIGQACALGLEPGGAMDHVYLIPRWNGERGVSECSIVVGYKGMMELARRSGLLKAIEAHVVYENDVIDVVWGTTTQVTHRPCLHGPRGSIIGAHCRADFTNGGTHHEYMTLEDIADVRAAAGKKSQAWAKWAGEMARKSVVRRAAKYWPQAVQMMDAIMVDGTASEDDDMRVYDVTPAPTPSDGPGPTAANMGRAMDDVNSSIAALASGEAAENSPDTAAQG